jgi:hypothetical protein
MGIFFILIGLVVSTGVASSEMYPHFKIYSNGISGILTHLHPFSNCNTLGTTVGSQNRKSFGRQNPKFIRWDEIACFDKFHYEQDRPSITVYLNKFDSYGKRNLPLTYKQYKEGRDAINTLILVLQKQDIEEIPVICPNCGKKPYAALEFCTFCKTKRF